MKIHTFFHMMGAMLIPVLLFSTCTKKPSAVGPTPSDRQLQWHAMERYAFVHFGLNTFTDKEWGYGNESPELFNPEQLDCRQWARVCKEAGMEGIILTAKHHDGFCLWPSAYTEHSVKNSPWKDGKGDLVRELSEACKEYGLKMGIYLSPWDRNHADYGTPAYIEYYRNQLRELLTNYGEVFEVWFDGANGGDGWYGGADERREIDRKTYYDWENTRAIVRELQPEAVMFSDAGPDVRWVGNERGWAGRTNWCLINRDEMYPGSPNHQHLPYGQENGTHWVPAEADVSIRPGWFYHTAQDNYVKTLVQLTEIYYRSVGRNASLLLNFPVDTRGLIHENDVQRVLELKALIDEDFSKDLLEGVEISASNVRNDSKTYAPAMLLDGNADTYWAPEEEVVSASVTVEFADTTTFNRFLVKEYIPLGQRVQAFALEYWKDGQWHEIVRETTIGENRILRFPDIRSKRMRFTVLEAKGCPLISEMAVYRAPVTPPQPLIARNTEGQYFMKELKEGLDIYYTTDGTQPDTQSAQYTGPIDAGAGPYIRAIAYDPAEGRRSDIASLREEQHPVDNDKFLQQPIVLDGQFEFLGVQRIWDVDAYSAFTDLILYKDAFYCTFRIGKEHGRGDKGSIRVLRSTDGDQWEPVYLMTLPDITDTTVMDARDPKLSVTPDGRLMLHVGVTHYHGREILEFQPVVTFSTDGTSWTDPQPVDGREFWPWKPLWYEDTAWVVAYRGEPREAMIMKSPDGIRYEKFMDLDIANTDPNEVALRTTDGGRMVALIRSAGDDDRAVLGWAGPPYTDWHYTKTAYFVGGPELWVIDEDNFLTSGRMRIGSKHPRTVVAKVDIEGNLVPALILPSGGDSSYPGIVEKDGIFWISYYSSHEERPSIYLAKMRYHKLRHYR